mmetsp:Transcript_14525/g.29661  ORF Transcript_14525/g.29661 Transcript_14525/m.29661 type:complete len:413 (-) Transcript_14525:28-1266(-)
MPGSPSLASISSTTTTAADVSMYLEQLSKLGRLNKQGVIDDEEFLILKKQIMSTVSPFGAAPGDRLLGMEDASSVASSMGVPSPLRTPTPSSAQAGRRRRSSAHPTLPGPGQRFVGHGAMLPRPHTSSSRAVHQPQPQPLQNHPMSKPWVQRLAQKRGVIPKLTDMQGQPRQPLMTINNPEAAAASGGHHQQPFHPPLHHSTSGPIVLRIPSSHFSSNQHHNQQHTTQPQPYASLMKHHQPPLMLSDDSSTSSSTDSMDSSAPPRALQTMRAASKKATVVPRLNQPHPRAHYQQQQELINPSRQPQPLQNSAPHQHYATPPNPLTLPHMYNNVPVYSQPPPPSHPYPLQRFQSRSVPNSARGMRTSSALPPRIQRHSADGPVIMRRPMSRSEIDAATGRAGGPPHTTRESRM